MPKLTNYLQPVYNPQDSNIYMKFAEPMLKLTLAC